MKSIQNEKDQIDEKMKTNKTEYNDIKEKMKTIKSDVTNSEKNLKTHQEQLKTNRDKLKNLLNDHRNHRKTLAQGAEKLRQIIEELPTAHLKLCNLLKKEKDSKQQLENAKHSGKIAEQNLKMTNKALTLGQEAFDTMNKFSRENRQAQVVGHDTKQRMLEERKTDVEKAKGECENQKKLLEKRENDYTTATSERIQAEKALENLEKQIKIEKNNVNESKKTLNNFERDIEEVEKQISDILVNIENAEKNNEELKGQSASQWNQMKLKKKEMELNQQSLNFILNKIKQYEAELNDLKSLKEDLNTQRNKMQKKHDEFVQSKNIISTTNEIRTFDLTKEADIRRIESEIFELKTEDNQLNERKNTLQRLSPIVSDKNSGLEKILRDQKRESEEIQKQIETLENKLQPMNITIEFAKKNIEIEEENQTALERYLRTKTTELIFRKYELINCQLTEYRLKKQIELVKTQQKKRRDDLEPLKNKLHKNEEESQNVRANIHNLQQSIDEENRSSSDIKYTKGEIEFVKKRISTINEHVKQLETEFMNIEPELNQISSNFKIVYKELCDFARKLIDIQPKILEKQLQINDSHHEIAGKEDIYRNYIEQRTKFTIDAYIHFYPKPETKTIEEK